jgi:excisionase family DNA binding protein
MTRDTQLLTPREVAERLRVSPKTVRRWVRKRTLDVCILPSGRYLIPVQAIEEVETIRARDAT